MQAFKKYVRTLLGLVIIALFMAHAIGVQHFTAIDALERRLYDLRLRATMPGGVDDRIVIADIDEHSLAQLGQWPWSRDILARLMDTLFDHYEVKVVGFDVIFAEPDNDSGLALLTSLARGPLQADAAFQEQYRKRRADLDHDRRFAESLGERNTVLGIVFGNDPGVRRNELPPPFAALEPADVAAQLPLVRPSGYVAALPALHGTAAASGFFDNPAVDADGVFRRVPLFQAVDGNKLYPSLALAIAWLAMDRPGFAPFIAENASGYIALEGVQLGSSIVPVDAQSNVLVPYRGPQRSFPYLSIADILERKLPKEQLAGRVVIVGTSAPGLLDLRTTPVEARYPGVEVHANVVAGIFDGSIKHEPAWNIGVEFVLLLVLGLIMVFVTSRLGPVWQMLLTGTLLAGTVTINMYAWHAGFVMPLATSLLLVGSLFVYFMSFGYFVESRGKREMTRLFGQYVPPELVDEMAQNPSAINFEGEQRELTVLFSDVRSFTTISEGLDPRELSALMNAYLTPMTRIIHQQRGTIDKYIGDAIMAFWGAPVRDPDHAREAVMAALAMRDEVIRLGEEFAQRGWPRLKIGIGINTGVMSVGNMGSEFRMAYTVMGDAVNLGSRLEGLSKQYGATIVVSETTRAAVPGIVYRPLDRVRVKGKAEPVRIYEPVGTEADTPPEDVRRVERLEHAIALYSAQRWDEAEAELRALAYEHEHHVYELYLERIAHFREEPPGEAWDGVFTHTTK